MDAKVTLSFDASVINKAKSFAEEQGLSLSRFIEVLLRKATNTSGYTNIEDLPIANWVQEVAEGPTEYIKKRGRKSMKDEFFNSKK